MSSSSVVIPNIQLAAEAYKLGHSGDEDENDIEQAHQAELAALREESAIQKQQAYDRGFREGQQKAQHEAAVRFNAECQRWAGLLQQLAGARREALHHAEGQLVELVLAATEKIIAARPPAPEKIADTLREAFSLLLTKDKLTIVCAPAEGVFIRELLSTHREEFEDLAKFVVREDAAISPGGCLVETEWGTIDARVEKRLAVLKRIWRDAAAQPPSEDQPTNE